jgi:hypothetical protein
MMDRFTYRQWADYEPDRITELGLAAPPEHRADWFKVQIRLAIAKALRHGQSGRAEDDEVVD